MGGGTKKDATPRQEEIKESIDSSRNLLAKEKQLEE